MKRQFFTHGVVYGAAHLVSGIGTIALVPIYTRALSPEQYGAVDYLVVVQTLVQIGAGLEITQGIARFYAGAHDEAERRAFASTGLAYLVTSVAAVCVLLFVAGAPHATAFVGPAGSAGVFGVALLSIFARILLYALQGQLRWELKPRAYAAAMVIAVGATVALSALALLVRDMGLAGVFWASTLGYGLGCGVCLIALRGTYRFGFDPHKLRLMLSFSIPLTVSALAVVLAGYGDRLIMRSMLGFHDLGIYGVGARFAAVVTLVINGFQLGAMPLIYRHYEDPETPGTLVQLMRVFLVVGAVVVIGLAAFSRELLVVVATPEYGAASPLVPVLALAILMGSLYTFTPGLTVRNLTGRFAVVNIVIAGVTLTLVAVFTRRFGPLGAAAGSLIGATAGFALHAAASQAVYPIPVDWRRLATTLVVTVMAIVACDALSAPTLASWLMRSTVCAAGGATLAIVALSPADRALAMRLVNGTLGPALRSAAAGRAR